MSDKPMHDMSFAEMEAELDAVCGQMFENRLKMVELRGEHLTVRMLQPDEAWVRLEDVATLVKAAQAAADMDTWEMPERSLLRALQEALEPFTRLT